MSFPDRCSLHVNKLEAFASWAQSVGYKREKTRGVHEVLRLRLGDAAPLMYFKRDRNMCGEKIQHVTAQAGDAARLVTRWLRERKEGER